MNAALEKGRARAVRFLVPLYMASGATSLVYECVWARRLHLVFGTSQLAICTVLAGFMAGLALGGLAAARHVDRIRRPLLAYALLEAFIGAYALAFPWILKSIEPLYLTFWHRFEPGPLAFGTWQFLVMVALLLPPTFCMGATLPVLARFAAAQPDRAGRQVSHLYGANTIGAVLGTAWAGFVLLPALGLNATTLVAALVNLALVVAALILSRMSDPVQPLEPSAADVKAGSPTVLQWFAFVAGFSGLLYEVAWFRLMVLILGGSTYAFSIMLLAFLLGIGLGGWCGGAAADRAFGRGGARRVMHLLAWIQVGIAALSWAAMFAYGELPFAFVWLYDKVESIPALIWPAKLVLALVIMLLPAILIGASFPFLVRASVSGAGDLGRPVGRLYGANTLGAVAGAFLGGFFLLSALGVRGTVLAAISLNLVAALFAIGAGPRRMLVRWAVASVVLMGLATRFMAPWDPMLMTSGMYQYVSELDDRSREGTRDLALRPFELVFYEEGLSSVVTVARDKKTGNLWLANNGKVDASSELDLQTQTLLAHLPFLFRPDAERILVIGLASGMSVGCVTLHEAPERIDVVEIEPAVVAASHVFDEVNHRPLRDPRVRLTINDARNHLQLAPDDAYELVISEPSNPWLSGVSSLFTREFLALGKRRMTPGGVWTQWIHTYGMAPDDLRSLLGTFADVYSHVRLFRIDSSDLVLVGSDAPLTLRGSEIRRMLGDRTVGENLREIGMARPEAILALYQMDRARIDLVTAGAPLNTDDNMRIEFSAPLYLHEDTEQENTRLLFNWAVVPFEAVEGASGLLELARAYLRLGDRHRALVAIRRARSLSPEDADVRVLSEFLEGEHGREQTPSARGLPSLP